MVLGYVVSEVFGRLPRSVGAFAPVASVAAAALAFGTADVMGGSGFLAVYLVGLAVGSTPSRYRRQIVAFHEGLAFLAQVAVFVALGLLVFPDRLVTVIGPGLVLSLVLMVVARPVAVWLATALSRFSFRDRVVLGWAGLRGAAPIVLATFVLSAHLDRADTIFDAVFFVVVVSTLVQGTTLERLARRLGLVDARPVRAQPPIEVDALGPLELVEFDVAGDHAVAGVAVREDRAAPERPGGGHRPGHRHAPAPRQHGHRARRPPVRPGAPVVASGARRRLRPLAPPGVTAGGRGRPGRAATLGRPCRRT